MRTIRLFLKRMKVEKSYLIVIAILSIFIVVGYFSYAMFTVSSEQKEAIRIITGTLTGELKVDNVETDKLVVNQGETKEFTIMLKNNNDRTARYLLYYIGTFPNNLEIGYIVGNELQIPPENKGRNIDKDITETYKIRVKNKTESSQTIQLKLDVGLDRIDLNIPSNGHLFEETKFTIPEGIPMKEYINEENTEYNDETKDKMFIYHHEAGSQQTGWTYDDLTDYRYIGTDPDNYVTFNGEEAGWRIIGVFTVENEKGEKEQRIKLIKNSPLKTSTGKIISLDNKQSGVGSSESNYGSNNWTDARLMMLLNPGYETNPLASDGKGSLYWESENGKCPRGNLEENESETVDCDFTSTGLTTEAQKMIGDTKWYLGACSTNQTKTNKLYECEHGTITCNTNGTCTSERPISWLGKVGLIYPSDYGYATSETACLTQKSEQYNTNPCRNNDWIFKSINPINNDTFQWTITPSSVNMAHVFFVSANGEINSHSAYSTRTTVRPVVYLKSNVQLSGTGTKEDPFVFTL